MFFHQTLQKQFTNIWKTLSLSGYPYSPFLGAALAGEETWTNEGKTRWQIFWQSCVQITIRGITEIGVSFGLSLKYVSYIYHSKRSKCAVSRFPTSSHPSDLFLNGQVRWLQGTDGLTCPRDSRCLQLGISQAAYRLDLPLCNFRGEFIHWPACPHGQVWVGPCWLKPAGAYQAKFSFPGCHKVHLTLASKSLNTQPVCFVQMPNADVQNTI